MWRQPPSAVVPGEARQYYSLRQEPVEPPRRTVEGWLRKKHCPVNADQEIESVTTLQIAEKTLILFWKKTRFLILI